jgi:hypothetical protein
LAPGSTGDEMKEDFVTQELPIPLLGVALDYPFTDRLHLISSLNGAYLPRVNSLRKEGGEVTLTQTMPFDFACHQFVTIKCCNI